MIANDDVDNSDWVMSTDMADGSCWAELSSYLGLP